MKLKNLALSAFAFSLLLSPLAFAVEPMGGDTSSSESDAVLPAMKCFDNSCYGKTAFGGVLDSGGSSVVNANAMQPDPAKGAGAGATGGAGSAN